jgi:hypothetical protein
MEGGTLTEPGAASDSPVHDVHIGSRANKTPKTENDRTNDISFYPGIGPLFASGNLIYLCENSE